MMNSNINNSHTRSFDDDWQSFSDNAFSAGQENVGPSLPVSSPTKASSSGVMDCSFTLPSPSKGRAFGDVMQPNCIVDIASMKTMSSCDASLTSAIQSDMVSTAAASDCGTESSSVAHLRGWLNGFGKQHQEHYSRTACVGKPPANVPLEKPIRPKVQPSVEKTPTPLPYTAASKLAKRIEPKSDPALKARAKTVGYNKPSVPKEDVQATDEGYASVAQLSAWLANDPTKTKKARPIRRGANVIAKSKQFDKELEHVVFEEKVVPRTNVANRKVWLENRTSMSSEKTEETAVAGFTAMKSSNMKPQETARDTEADDSVMLMSVSEKKKWLSHAFNKQKSSFPVKKSLKRDKQEATMSIAKKMWRTSDNPPDQTYESSFSTSVSSEAADVSAIFRDSAAESCTAQEEEPPVDFHAARRLLVERSKANGNDVEVVSKVQVRTAKFEKLEKESRRVSGAHTLLKSSWEEAESGRRSSYVKKYVPDICPKKSFDQLP
jgi:hypothetical protein